jgi:tetratricopeptide (TPR) repeat protein
MQQGLDDEIIEPDAKAFKLLADSWLMARDTEKSFEPLTTAAELSEDGDLYIRLGQAYIAGEAWKRAEASFEEGLEKGELDEEGLAYLLLGVSQFNLDKFLSARSSFRKAAKHDETKLAAGQWITHTNRKLGINIPPPGQAPEPEEKAQAEAADTDQTAAAAASQPAG